MKSNALIVFLSIMILAAAFYCGIAEAAAREAKLVKVAGEVKIQKVSTAEEFDAKEGMMLTTDNVIKIGSRGDATISFPTGKSESLVHLYSNSELAIKELSKSIITGSEKTILGLAVGKVQIKAAKLKNNSRFELCTPTSVIGVRGTEYEVVVSAQ